jgi:hypothetical protein
MHWLAHVNGEENSRITQANALPAFHMRHMKWQLITLCCFI